MASVKRIKSAAKKASAKAATNKALQLAKLNENRELFASELLTSFLPECLANIKRLADGVKVKKTNSKGREFVYERPPNLRANMYLIDRLLGGPRRSIELSGKDGGAIPIMIVLPDNGRDAPAQAELPAPGDVAVELG